MQPEYGHTLLMNTCLQYRQKHVSLLVSVFVSFDQISRAACVLLVCAFHVLTNTVKPPNKGHIGTRFIVFLREVVRFLEVYKCSVDNYMKTSIWDHKSVLWMEVNSIVSFIECPLLEVPLYLHEYIITRVSNLNYLRRNTVYKVT